MLKNEKFNIFLLAQKNNFKRFVYFKVTLRDKIKYDIELVDGFLNFFKNTKKLNHIVYACQTIMRNDQSVPPRNNSFLSFKPMEQTYSYETSTLDILIECSDKDFKLICDDISDNHGIYAEQMLYLSLEYFGYKYDLAVSGNDFIEIADLCVGSFECFCYYRDKKNGKYKLGKFIVSPSSSIIKLNNEKNLSFQNIINKDIPIWKYFLNKTKYLYSTYNNLECVMNASIAIEAYIIYLIKKENKYDKYKQENKSIGYRVALQFAKDNKLIDSETADIFENGYEKICLQRSLIVHGAIDTPIVDREKAKISYETVIDIFMSIEKKLDEDNDLSVSNQYFENDYRQMNKIIEKYNNADYNSAIDDLNHNIENNIFKDLSIFTRAKCFSKIKMSQKAIEDYNSCIINRYRLIESYNLLGKELGQIHKHAEAKKVYLEAIQLDSGYPEYYYNLGIEQHFLKEYDNAIHSYEQALKLRECACYYYNLGVTYFFKGDYENTLFYYNKAIHKEPNNSVYLYERASLYEMLKNPQMAEKDIVKCLKFYEGRPHIAFIRERIFQIGVLYQKEGNFRDAIRVFTRGYKVNNKSDAYYQARGNCYRSIGELKKAKADYHKALKMDPNSYRNLINITYLYLDIGDIEKASEYFYTLTSKYSKISEVKDCMDFYYYKCYQQEKISSVDFINILKNNHENVRESDFYKKLVEKIGEKETNKFLDI